MKIVLNFKKLIPVFIFLSFCLAGCQQTKTSPSAKPTAASPQSVKKPTSEPKAKEPNINFSKSGNILNWDAEKERETDQWRLLYEEPPDKPALTVDLSFNKQSSCNNQPCSQVKLENGDQVKIEGVKEGKTVTVVNLTKFSSPQ